MKPSRSRYGIWASIALYVLLSIPLLIAFHLGQRYFVEGIRMTGLKG